MDDDGTGWFRLPVASASQATGVVCLVLYRLPLTFSGSVIMMDGRPEESTGSACIYPWLHSSACGARYTP